MKGRNPATPARDIAGALQRMRQGLLSNLAHDLRSPLVAIRGYAKLVRAAVAERHEGAERSHIELVLENVERIVALTGRAARLAQYGAWQVEVCDLARMIDGATRAVRDVADSRSIRIVRGPGATRTFGDPSKLERTIESLLRAAVASAGDGAEIAVELTEDPEEEEIVFRVASPDFGFDEEERDSLFERAELSRHEPEEGRALALWEADDIVRLHGGRLDFAEIEDGRFAFILRLPRFRPAALEEGGGQR